MDQEDVDRGIRRDYLAWKKIVPILYDNCLLYAPEWPSLTAQWLPYPAPNDPNIHAQAPDDNTLLRYRSLLGTHGSPQNALMLVDVTLPANHLFDQDLAGLAERYQVSQEDTYLASDAQFKVVKRVKTGGSDVHRARYMPQDPRLLALQSSTEQLKIIRIEQALHSTFAKGYKRAPSFNLVSPIYNI